MRNLGTVFEQGIGSVHASRKERSAAGSRRRRRAGSRVNRNDPKKRVPKLKNLLQLGHALEQARRHRSARIDLERLALEHGGDESDGGEDVATGTQRRLRRKSK